MATKRTKADKAQRQADQLDKKSERRPEQGTSQKKQYARGQAEPLNPTAHLARQPWDANPLRQRFLP